MRSLNEGFLLNHKTKFIVSMLKIHLATFTGAIYISIHYLPTIAASCLTPLVNLLLYIYNHIWWPPQSGVINPKCPQLPMAELGSEPQALASEAFLVLLTVLKEEWNPWGISLYILLLPKNTTVVCLQLQFLCHFQK